MSVGPLAFACDTVLPRDAVEIRLQHCGGLVITAYASYAKLDKTIAIG
ncbi:Uncharacterised protein [Mycobacteroides abscessus subsp. massiliense]|nr:Uncharacterised protein [Mycobacteroides abscessus subsp. massiliense]SKW53346.1 Uncharacterised protein [Mycobacteroides abscessus subsp. abscessus]SKJ60325.1 Uncharacterised protein [Mycobacteroides abscessus subsp. massiliense]SKJ73346.1 Uncharacterised protein [Mycobacteroides abscessus subsp. massiliense]SKL00589.1 Uncharacterised protein [Mycobacteroides abscessus subsp. massiliense]